VASRLLGTYPVWPHPSGWASILASHWRKAPGKSGMGPRVLDRANGGFTRRNDTAIYSSRWQTVLKGRNLKKKGGRLSWHRTFCARLFSIAPSRGRPRSDTGLEGQRLSQTSGASGLLAVVGKYGTGARPEAGRSQQTALTSFAAIENARGIWRWFAIRQQGPSSPDSAQFSGPPRSGL